MRGVAPCWSWVAAALIFEPLRWFEHDPAARRCVPHSHRGRGPSGCAPSTLPPSPPLIGSSDFHKDSSMASDNRNCGPPAVTSGQLLGARVPGLRQAPRRLGPVAPPARSKQVSREPQGRERQEGPALADRPLLALVAGLRSPCLPCPGHRRGRPGRPSPACRPRRPRWSGTGRRSTRRSAARSGSPWPGR